MCIVATAPVPLEEVSKALTTAENPRESEKGGCKGVGRSVRSNWRGTVASSQFFSSNIGKK